MRFIDADALKKENERLLHCDFPYLSETTFEELIDEAPTIDTVPSETLYDFIKKLGSITYGKERFFREDNGTWYDREHADYITLDDVIRRIVDAVREEEEE